jgi:hypothetical protein
MIATWTLIVMLHHGGGATISGFTTPAACARAASAWAKANARIGYHSAVCVEVK